MSRGASYLTIQTLVTSLAQVLCFAVLARIITPSEVGILAVLSLITSLSQAINGGVLSQASMKYVGEYTETNKPLAAGVVYQTLCVSMIISLPIAGFIFFESSFLAHELLHTAFQTQLFRVLAVDVLVYAGALPVANGALLGAMRFKESAAIGTVGAVLRQCLIILLILLQKSFVGLVYAWTLSDFITFVGYMLYALRVFGLGRNPFSLTKLLAFSWPLTVGNLISFAYTWFDRAILIGLVPLASLGIYNASLYALGVLTSIAVAFGNVLLPVYSSISARGVEARRGAIWHVSRYMSLVMAPLAFGLFATAKPALTLFVGQAYEGGAVPLMVMSLSFALSAFGSGLFPMLTALAKTRAGMLITMVSTILALISAFILLPFMGITGAAVARALSNLAGLALTIIVLRQVGAMSVDVEMAWKSMVAGAVMVCVLIAVQLVVYSTRLLPFYVLLGAIVYVISLRGLKAVRKHDIELLERYFGSRLGFVARFLSIVLLASD